jgi:hypothetical protein
MTNLRQADAPQAVCGATLSEITDLPEYRRIVLRITRRPASVKSCEFALSYCAKMGSLQTLDRQRGCASLSHSI